MRNVVEYATANDPKKPDFGQDCVEEGTVRRSAIGRDAETKTPEEVSALQEREDQYYRENWHRALLGLLKYKNPAVASMDNHTLLARRADDEESQAPIYFHVDFVKPGKTTYMVEHKAL